jgi:sn-glycerol 3-phosphate transport system substrate-binding protein
MGGALGEWVNDLAKEFNASQKDYKVVPTFKGSYDESMTAGIAAYRAGNAPHMIQVFEVGTATMMAAKGAIVPVAEVMNEAGLKFDPSVYVPAVAGYYTAPNGQMLSFPFNSSTPVFHYNKDAFKAAGLDAEKPPTTWPEVALAAAKLKASGHKCPFTTSWISWTQLESFSAWHNVLYATKNNGFGGNGRAPGIQQPAARAPHRKPGQHGQERPVCLQGPRQRGRCHLRVGRMRHGHRLVGPGRQRQAQRQVRLRHLAPCPTTPMCPARRRTP